MWKVLEEDFPREKWIIGLEDLTIGDVIGQGAFGLVKKAKLVGRKYIELLNRHEKSEATVNPTTAETSSLLTSDGHTVHMIQIATFNQSSCAIEIQIQCKGKNQNYFCLCMTVA